MKKRLLIYVCLCFLACHDEAMEKKAFIDAEVSRKVEDFRSSRMEKCMSDILRQVVKDADSIMLKRAFFDIPDSLAVPEKRRRPVIPGDNLPEFQSPQAPHILSDSISKK